MLVLTRKVGERIVIGPNVFVTVIGIQNGRVKLGIEAPSEVPIHRDEVSRRFAERGREWAARGQADLPGASQFFPEFA